MAHNYFNIFNRLHYFLTKFNMARPRTESLKDIDIMADATDRLKNVTYPNTYFEERYNTALSRIISDLDESGSTFVAMFGNDKLGLIQALRMQFSENSTNSKLTDKPMTLPPDSIQW